MIDVVRAMCVTSALLFLPSVAAAETGPPRQNQPVPAASPAPDGGTLVPALHRATERGAGPFAISSAPRERVGPPAPLPQGGASPRRRDSLWNGVLVGAGLGALLGAVGGNAVLECSECAGFNVPLTFGVIGAGVGAGIGAGIDALRQTRSTVPITRGRITVAPLLGPGRRAVVAQVHF